jgi:hypothetical protein
MRKPVWLTVMLPAFFVSTANMAQTTRYSVPGDKQDENLATIRMRKMTPAA